MSATADDFVLSSEVGRWRSLDVQGCPVEQKKDLWARWKAGESLSTIGRALGRHAGSIHGVLASRGGRGATAAHAVAAGAHQCRARGYLTGTGGESLPALDCVRAPPGPLDRKSVV